MWVDVAGSNISIYQKIKILKCFSLITSDLILDFLAEISIFIEMSIFDNLFLAKCLICDQNLDFWTKFIFSEKLQFAHKNFDFGINFRFLTTISTFHQNFEQYYL